VCFIQSRSDERGGAHLGKQVEIEGVWVIKVILVLEGEFEFFWAMWLVETVLKWRWGWDLRTKRRDGDQLGIR
jgi:hypothetical protein